MFDPDRGARSIGQEAERAFAYIFRTYLPHAQVLPERVKQPDCALALVKTSEEVDRNEGYDFWLYHQAVGWIKVDLTVARADGVLDEKKRREQERGIFVLRFGLRCLMQAARGCHRDLQDFELALVGLFLDARERRQRSACSLAKD